MEQLVGFSVLNPTPLAGIYTALPVVIAILCLYLLYNPVFLSTLTLPGHSKAWQIKFYRK
jgi:hypothetical protein